MLFFMKILKKENRGGLRLGAGRKSLFKGPTKGIKFMCPVSKIDELKKLVANNFLSWRKDGL